MIAIHGDANQLRCTACAWTLRVGNYSELERLPLDDQAVPCCPECGAVVRPAVVLFEEMLPPAAVDRLHAELRQGFDALISPVPR